MRRSFSWTFAGTGILAAANWCMLTAVAKLSTTVAVGQFALALSIVTPLFMFANMGLRTSQATDARSEFMFADYFTLRCLGIAAASVITGLIVAAWRLDRSTTAVILMMTVVRAVESFGEIIAGLLQKAERLDLVARAQMMRAGASIIVFPLVLIYFNRLTAAVGALAVVWSVITLAYDVRLARRLIGPKPFWRLNLPMLRRLAGVSLPLAVITGLSSLNVNIPQYLIQHYMGPTYVGAFVSVAYLLLTVRLIVNALGQSASARLARMFASGEFAPFLRLVRKLAVMGAALGLVLFPVTIFLGRLLLTLLYRPEYAKYTMLLSAMTLVAGVYSVSLFLGYGVEATRYFWIQVPVTGAGTAVAFIASLLLVPGYGLYGAAFALLAAGFAQALGSALVLAGAIGGRQGRHAGKLSPSSAKNLE